MKDIIFIGGGLNYAGAIVAAKRGFNVALIEKNINHLGGVCLHNGCIPSKHFLHLSKINLELRNEAFRIKKDKIKLDIVQKQLDNLLSKATKSIILQCENAGVELIEGDGYVVDEGKIKFNSEILEAEHIVIGTGSSPFIPEGIEYNGESIVTSDEILKLKNFPESIAIYGSGAVGLEFAGFFAANGIDVTLFYIEENISNKMHPFINKNIENGLTKIGVKLMPSTRIYEAKDFERKARVTTDKGIYEFDKLLVATGRKPNTEVIKTDKIEVSNAIVTDDFFETTLKKHFAIGDCNAKQMIAHSARAQVLNVIDRITEKKSKKLSLINIPKFIYSLPLGYASVGLTKSYLETQGIVYKETVFSLSAFSHSYSHNAADGMVILYADEKESIKGAEILAPNAEELISVATTAVTAGLDKESFLDIVFAHPTFSEAFERAARRL
ncbi:dihydrolipoyl dehydrogenase family protein [Nitrosophilus alvini]|uniref:dihydrolipoyl dehydrogenase family protein n=1 Tax=Nitrosophilus alvini TaxID=2714855 RepID=UPI00190E460F|nr:NAD(P)/FAD-dependent oxidoreductase [Nitrosophilus alvini]